LAVVQVQRHMTLWVAGKPHRLLLSCESVKGFLAAVCLPAISQRFSHCWLTGRT